MPVLQPAEAWQKTGRYEIDELFKLQDRKGAELVLAMTHEEAVTTHVAQVVRSYRDLPLILYHFQVKERDEPRPRAGVLRTREFVMKDSYTFDRDAAGLDERYELHVGAYDRIMERTGPALLPRRGGRRDDGRARARTSTWRRARRARTRSCWRAATRPTSRSRAPTRSRSTLPAAPEAPEPVEHAGADRRSATSPAELGLPEGALLKAYPVVVEARRGAPRAARDGAAARRSPGQRDQARERAGRALPPGAAPRRSSRRSGRPATSARSSPRSDVEIAARQAPSPPGRRAPT